MQIQKCICIFHIPIYKCGHLENIVHIYTYELIKHIYMFYEYTYMCINEFKSRQQNIIYSK